MEKANLSDAEKIKLREITTKIGKYATEKNGLDSFNEKVLKLLSAFPPENPD